LTVAADRREATERARRLLRALLSDDEYQQYVRDGYLKVKSPSYPNREYRIPNFAGMVLVYENEKPAMRLCVGPTRALPTDDVVVTHLLMIRGDELRYLSKANAFPYLERSLGDLLRVRVPWDGGGAQTPC
jgi:hypothetical protein